MSLADYVKSAMNVLKLKAILLAFFQNSSFSRLFQKENKIKIRASPSIFCLPIQNMLFFLNHTDHENNKMLFYLSYE